MQISVHFHNRFMATHEIMTVFNEVVIQLVNSISKPGQSCSLYCFLIARFARSRVLLQVRYVTPQVTKSLLLSL